jgi:hypothetical protein
MSPFRFFVPALAALFVFTAAPGPIAAQAGPAQPYCGTGYGNGVMGFLTPDQRMMHFAEVQKATANMSFDDMRNYRLNLRSKVMAMNAAERKNYADDLSTKWNALSADQRAQIQQDFMAYRGSGRWGRGMGMGRGMGHGMGGGCWW